MTLPGKINALFITAVLVLEANATVGESDIKFQLTDRLARYKQPKRVFFCEQLPRNSMGKVQKNLLRDQFRETYSETVN